ncbi:hypothetical protein ALC56_00785 [Trachymyrmex septentrionalis]|uniref:Uncharacterized protein n=1 Tax=Trachymyrmex septentrionalis TaxID=34720 RepID=A0A195FVW2_9HYME|nr:hypothetical protein ALC56_00785 [Trachymyrmex septentrionalis]
MRSAIFPRIHGRWKSSRNKERGTFANGDCTQCAHVGAAIPQLVTYVPLVTGGRSRSRNPLVLPAVLQHQLLRQPLHLYGRRWLFSSGEAFHSRNWSTKTRTKMMVNTARKDKLTFDLYKTLDFAKVLSLSRSSTFFVLSQKSR